MGAMKALQMEIDQLITYREIKIRHTVAVLLTILRSDFPAKEYKTEALAVSHKLKVAGYGEDFFLPCLNSLSDDELSKVSEEANRLAQLIPYDIYEECIAPALEEADQELSQLLESDFFNEKLSSFGEGDIVKTRYGVGVRKHNLPSLGTLIPIDIYNGSKIYLDVDQFSVIY